MTLSPQPSADTSNEMRRRAARADSRQKTGKLTPERTAFMPNAPLGESDSFLSCPRGEELANIWQTWSLAFYNLAYLLRPSIGSPKISGTCDGGNGTTGVVPSANRFIRRSLVLVLIPFS